MTRDLDTENWLAEKLTWANTACRDPKLSHLQVRIVLLTMNDLHGVQKCAFRGQDGIAALIGSNPRSVREALAGLIKAGYLRKMSRGRANTNAYYPTLPTAEISETQREPGSHDRQISAGHVSRNDALADVMTGDNPPPRPAESRRLTLRENPSPPYPPKSGRQRQRLADPTQAMIRNAPVFLDRRVRQAFVAIHGEPATISWLDPQRWEPAKGLIVCRGSTAYGRLTGDYRKTLAEIGVRVVLDATRFNQLPCPTFSDRIAA